MARDTTMSASAVGDATAGDSAAGDGAAEDTAPESGAPKGAAPQESAPKDSAPQQDSARKDSALAAGSSVIDVTRLRVALARLSRRLRRHELAGLTPTQLAALSTVEQAGPLRLGDLAAAEGIAPSTVTRMVAVLEDLGYVRRNADPTDARASTLAITAKGHQTLEQLRDEGTAMLTEWLALLAPAQRAAIATALPALEALGEPSAPTQRSR